MNPIEHFQMDTNRHALEASSAVVLGPLFDFIGEAFDERDLSYEESELLQEIRTLLVSLQTIHCKEVKRNQTAAESASQRPRKSS